MTLDDAAFVSFRAQRLVIPSAARNLSGSRQTPRLRLTQPHACHSERSEESQRVAPDPAYD
ncbi:MAG: hypothetical protein KatS3mg058_2798 [Roseiflexus sp.]|nr:MAG: hypothetical protein KatS3mg058_2798 [Roseiflexus sp.]